MREWSMNDYIFVFDLDSTLTKKEILPEIAKHAGCYEQMRGLTEAAMRGDTSFEKSFVERVELLKTVPISLVKDIVANIGLNELLMKFIQEHRGICKIATGNLDVWIEQLIKDMDMQGDCFCSVASYQGDYLLNIDTILNKEDVVRSFDNPVVAIGDGANDIEMVRAADIGIGFGGVRQVAPALLPHVQYHIKDEKDLYNLLIKLVEK